MAITVPIDWESRFDKALKDFDRFSSSAQKSLDKTSKSMGLLEFGAKAFVGAFTVGKIIQGLTAIVTEASEAEQTMSEMNNALIAAGNFSEHDSRKFKMLSVELARASKFTDGMVLAQVKLAKQFNISNAQVDKLIRTAVDLSAVTGDDLNVSVKNLGMTLDGTAGKLSNVFPELKKLTDEQLRNGAAIDLLAQKYQGFSEKSLNTFSGRVTQARKEWGEFLEGLGSFITQSRTVNAAIELMTSGLTAMTAMLDGTSNAAARFGRGWTYMFGSAAEKAELWRARVMESNVEARKGGSIFVDAAKGMDKFRTSLDKYDDSAKRVMANNKEMLQGIEALKKELADAGLDEWAVSENKFSRQQDEILKGVRSGILTQMQGQDMLFKLELAHRKKISDLTEDDIKKQEELLQKQGLLGLNVKPKDAAMIQTGLGFGSSMLKGKEGIGSAVQGLGTMMGGPLGGAIGGFLAELGTLGADGTRKMISGFIDAVPDFIQNIIEALPEIIFVLAEKLGDPGFWLRIANAFINGIGKLIPGLMKNWSSLMLGGAGKFIVKLLEGAAKFVGELIKAIGKALGIGGSDKSLIGGSGRGGFEDAIGVDIPGVHLKARAKASAPTQLVVQTQISGKHLATAIVDLQKMGWKLVPA